MAITLLDEVALEKQNLRKGILMTLVKYVSMMDRIPFETTGALHLTVTYLAGVPTVPLRHLNETPASSQANFSQMNEALQILDTDVEVDPVLVDNQNVVQPVHVAHTQAVVKAIGYRFNDLFVNGDPTSDARQPAGLKYRLSQDPRFSGMTINATGNTVELDCRPNAADADLLTWLNRLDQLHYLLEQGTDVFVVNQQTMLSLWAALRKLRLLDVTKDQFEREIIRYRGVSIVDIGYKPSGAVTGVPASAGQAGDQIIGNDSEAASGQGANAYSNQSPIYAVRFGDGYTVALQQTPLRVKPFGETETPPHFVRTNIRWVVSPCVPFQKRSIARLVGCAVSVAPA